MSRTRSSDAQTDTHIDDALRALDAAPSTPLDEPTRLRAEAAFKSILSTAQTTPGRAGRDPLLPRRRRTALRVSVLALAAGIAVLGVSTSQVLGGGTAYADSWAPVPTPASQADTAAASKACAEGHVSTSSDRVAHLQSRLAERRGDLVLVVMDDEATTLTTTLTCIVDLPPGNDAKFIASGGGGGRRPGVDVISDGGLFEQTTPGDELSVIDGLVSEDVTAVTVHALGGRVVQATVQGGHYAAWWPGLAMRETTTPPTPGMENNCEGDCKSTFLVPTYTLDVTLEDGTVLRDVSRQSM